MVFIKKFSLLLIGLTFSYTSCQIDPWDRVPKILSRIKPPTIPTRVCDIHDFGATRSAFSDVEAPSATVDVNAKAFKDAIDHCNSLGGGIVYVPAGTFITSAITLKSNIALHISTQAIVRFTRDTSKYSSVFTRWEGVEVINYSSLIYAYKEENIAVTGNGILDGNADCEHWWPWAGSTGTQCWANSTQNQRNDRPMLFQMAENNVPVEQRQFGQGHFLRPQFIQPYLSKNVLIEGVTVINSPMWIIHPVLCENVIVRNVKLNSSGPNNDGIDPESCKDVWITGVTFNSGDDDIAIKSGRNADGRRINVPSENYVIQNCTMADEMDVIYEHKQSVTLIVLGHGGVTIGSEISGGVKNIFAENCDLDSPHLWTAFRIKNNAVRGGTLEDIYVRNMRVGQVERQVIEVDFYYEEGTSGDFRPILRDYKIENIKVNGGAPYSLYIRGYPDHPKSSYIGISLRNISFVGLTNDPHYVLQDIDYYSSSDITVDGVKWDATGSSSAGHQYVKYEMMFILFVSLFTM